MESEHTEWEHLVVKKITQGLSPEEQVVFDKYINEHPGKEREADAYAELWKKTGTLPVRKGLSQKERWTNLQRHIREEETPFRKFSIPRWMKVAASLAALAVVLGVYVMTRSTTLSVTAAYGETKTITLPDQSVIQLNAGTTITYDPSSWEKERVIRLTGEAFFNVKKNGAPFIVSSGNAEVKVLGTTFNVRAREQVTDVTCVTGSVRVSEQHDHVKHVVLTKGNRVVVDSSGLSLVSLVPAPDAVQWTTGGLSFKETPLVEVFAELERHFNRKIMVSPNTKEKIITAKFPQPQLESTLHAICLSAGLTYRINPDLTITIE